MATPNGFGHYWWSSFLISIWVVLIILYICLLERSVQEFDFLGPLESDERRQRIAFLGFFRTLLSVMHIPVVTSVLAAYIPWVMTRRGENGTSSENEALYVTRLPTRKRVVAPELFFLVDRTWSGITGWLDMIFRGLSLGAFSYRWLQLAVIIGLSYLGFPFLSLSYTFNPIQYWVSQKVEVPVTAGGLSSSYDQVLSSLHNVDDWVKNGAFDQNTPKLGENIAMYGSSSKTGASDLGLLNQSIWGTNGSFISGRLEQGLIAQVPVVGLLVSSFCRMDAFNNTKYWGRWMNSTEDPVEDTGGIQTAFTFSKANSNTSTGLPYELRCKDDCSGTNHTANLTCSNLSTINYLNTCFPTRIKNGTNSYGFVAQMLSCISIEETSSTFPQANASIQLAVQGPETWTSVATCNISIAYARPVVNSLLEEYMDGTAPFNPPIPLSQHSHVSPAQLLNLTIEGFIHFYHFGSKSNESSTNGFSWVTNYPEDSQDMGTVRTSNKNMSNSAFCPGASWAHFFHYEVRGFTEDVFLIPLARIINNQQFFQYSTSEGVIFKSTIKLEYGIMPRWASIAVLFLPVAWALLLSIYANKDKRWTSTLDSFSMFKLGGDWTEPLREVRLATMTDAKNELMSIPGLITVSPDIRHVRLR